MRVCDRCGHYPVGSTMRVLNNGTEIDLCVSCGMEFQDWLKVQDGKEEAQTDTPKRGRRKRA